MGIMNGYSPTTKTMLKVKKKKSPQEWSKKDIEKLPINSLKVLKVFVKKNKDFLDFKEIKKKGINKDENGVFIPE